MSTMMSTMREACVASFDVLPAQRSTTEWSRFVNQHVERMPDAQARAVRTLWATLNANGLLPLPKVEWTERSTMRFSWSRHERFLEVAIGDDERGEWFLSVDLPSGRLIKGTEEDPEVINAEDIASYVRQYFQV